VCVGARGHHSAVGCRWKVAHDPCPELPSGDAYSRDVGRHCRVCPFGEPAWKGDSVANGGSWRGWGVAFAMILLSAVPVAAGTVRLVSLANGVEATPENVRFVSSPVPVVLHVVGAMVLMVPGAFQFVPGLHRRAMGWHRWMGRLAVGAGVVVALSGLWMAQFYRLPIHDGALVYAFRLLFGAGMTYAFVKAFVAVRRRDIAGHRAWMVRGYAIGLGAGTQVVTLLAGEVALGPPDAMARGWLMGGAWVFNAAIAEWIVRRSRSG